MSTVEKLINTIFVLVTKFLPLKKKIIFESSPDFSDNTYWFFKYLAENTDVFTKYKPIWIISDRTKKRDELCSVPVKCIFKTHNSLGEFITTTIERCTAKFIVDSNSYVPKKHKKQKRIFLGHGMPFKVAETYVTQKGEVDMNIITTYEFNDIFHKLGDTDEKMRNFGYCRNDILAEHAGTRKNRETTSIIWMPTYRQHTKVDYQRIENNFPLGLPIIKSNEQMEQINAFLKENNTILYLRPHPAQDLSIMKIDNMSNIIIADNAFLKSKGLQLYEFLTETDALISDYSSVYYDYLLIERPIALALEDLEDFRSKWPIAFDDVEANYKCPYLYNTDDLKEFIKNVASDSNIYHEELVKAKNRFNDYTDNKTCERLYNFMVKEYGL